MPKGDDGVMDNLDSHVERVEVFNAETRIPQAKPVREADALAGVSTQRRLEESSH